MSLAGHNLQKSLITESDESALCQVGLKFDVLQENGVSAKRCAFLKVTWRHVEILLK